MVAVAVGVGDGVGGTGVDVSVKTTFGGTGALVTDVGNPHPPINEPSSKNKMSLFISIS
jgi:hypothetical protein